VRSSPADALAAITELEETTPTGPRDWHLRRDLLNSGGADPQFVVEVEADGTAGLRFGDDRRGARPEPGTTFTIRYRVGTGAAGNVGAGSLIHAVTAEAAVAGVVNPLPAVGGTDPETVEEVRVRAPAAFRTQERAVTPEDYAAIALRHPGVQRAAATFRWTGSWYTVFVTVDRLGGLPVDAPFKAEVVRHLDPFRMAGHDLEIDGPRFVSLDIELQVCARPDYFRSEVKAALLEVFGRSDLPGGRRGLFHPDNFTFGQSVYLSRLIAAAQAVPGVASVSVTRFQRQGTPDPQPLADGKLDIGRLEVARLDNDPNFPEHGKLQIRMGGGK
jgi:predicted phage baseplate assembly protein